MAKTSMIDEADVLEPLAVRPAKAALMCDVTTKTLSRWEGRGFLKSIKVGGVKR